MDMTPCKSSQVEAYGYDHATHTLALRFRNGNALYHYFDVPLSEFDGLKSCDSVGKFLGQRIKGKYRFERISAGGLGQIDDQKRRQA